MLTPDCMLSRAALETANFQKAALPSNLCLGSNIRIALQEAEWTPYPTFTDLHQIVYRTEPNIYEGFELPAGVTEGWADTHVNEEAMDLIRGLLQKPVQLMLEVEARFEHANAADLSL